MTETKPTYAAESGHWYTLTGEPAYTVKAKSGEDRPTTLRDARKLNLVPSVTTVTKILEKPALGAWLQRQVLMAALTLTRKPDENDEAWIARIMADSQEQTKAAAERGTLLHGQIEGFLSNTIDILSLPKETGATIFNIIKSCLDFGVDLENGNAEHSFAHADGFGGKVDWHNDGTVVDFKTKDVIGDKTGKELAYDEHAMQLAAYAYGLGIIAPRCINVFIGVTDGKVVVVEHDAVAIGRGLRMFKLALQLWQEKNNYTPVIA